MSAPAPLEAAAFRAWLAGKPPAAIVGRAGISTRCPLACYLREALEAPDPFVSRSVFAFNSDDLEHRYALPTWAATFVAQLDGPDESYEAAPDGFRVPAQTALTLLDAVLS